MRAAAITTIVKAFGMTQPGLEFATARTQGGRSFVGRLIQNKVFMFGDLFLHVCFQTYRSFLTHLLQTTFENIVANGEIAHLPQSF